MLDNAKYFPGGPHMLTSKRNNRIRDLESLVRQNTRLARSQWPGEIGPRSLCVLKSLTREFRLSLASGEILLLNSSWYVTAAGLLRLARDNRCCGIHVHAVSKLCDAESGRWVFKATVYKSPGSKAFVGYGDADPSNVSFLVHGAELRVAETRAVNRALRKAYGIGLCSVEELWSFSPLTERARVTNRATELHTANGQPRLRDRLCLLIRQHQLDPSLVKRYAADFCGTEALRDASRDLVESFITELAEWAAKDREGLVCKLNSYAQTEEAKS